MSTRLPASEQPDSPYSELAFWQLTHARVGLGRSGSGMPTSAWLKFRADHALAREAVYESFDVQGLEEACACLGLDTIVVDTQARTREEFLRTPVAGRQLDERSSQRLERLAYERAMSRRAESDVSFVLTDGLSAMGVNLHAGVLLDFTVEHLREAGTSIGPVVIARRGRVGLMNEVGAALRSTSVALLIGERPGLSAPDSVGAYFEYDPGARLTDADRNCISNIRPAGLPLQRAANQLAELIVAGLDRKCSGTRLRVETQFAPAIQERIRPTAD